METSLRALLIGFCLSCLLVIAKFLGIQVTWQVALLPLLIPLAITLALIINIVALDGIQDIKNEMEDKRK